MVLPSGNISFFSINVVRPFYEKKASKTMKIADTRPLNETEDTATASSDHQRTIMTRPQTRRQ